jgi:hypothetical protein
LSITPTTHQNDKDHYKDFPYHKYIKYYAFKFVRDPTLSQQSIEGRYITLRTILSFNIDLESAKRRKYRRSHKLQYQTACDTY